MHRLYPNIPLSEPDCIYDNPDDISEGPKTKISRLETEIEELQEIIREKDDLLAQCVCRVSSTALTSNLHATPSAAVNVSMSPPLGNNTRLQPLRSSPPTETLNYDPTFDTISLPARTPQFPAILPFGSEPLAFPDAAVGSTETSISSDVWPQNIPPRELLTHLVNTVFNYVPLASSHVTLLHAFCALASLYTPIVLDMNPLDLNEPLYVMAAALMTGGAVNHGCRYVTSLYLPGTFEDEDHDFASAHLQWCRLAFYPALERGDALIQQMQVIHMAKERNERDLDYCAYAMHRILNATNILPLLSNDEDCSQMMPCRLRDFEAGLYVPGQGRQRLFSQKMHIIHPLLTTDAFTLYIKASSLLGKVKTFNGRFRYKYTDGDGTGMPCTRTTLEEYPADDTAPPRPGLVKEVTTTNPRDTDDFHALDALIEAFIGNVPRDLKDPVGLDTGAKLNPTLYMAHMLPHMAMIMLHDPHANVFSLQDPSAVKLLKSARAIMDYIYKVCGTPFDLIYLDHASSMAWFMAGVTLIRFLYARTVQKDEAEIARLSQELGVVRFMLGNLGNRTAVGVRQIKLLEMVYKVEMGSHASPDDQSSFTYSATVREV
ncbi:hypothetical protein FRB96_005914 [Tulasnella sp. 330]|nr:hypothetical protein FRB96_005914 [Tulasnella sp. 330]